MNLQEIDSAKIIILVDNITDRLLSSSSLVKRPPMVSNQKIARAPIAEHGFQSYWKYLILIETRSSTTNFSLIPELVKTG
jgi:hypothetical protein